jgi:hypothetical protein
MMTVKSFSAYDAKALKLLTGVLFDVKRAVEVAAKGHLSVTEHEQVTKTVAENLMRIFDSGERDPDALKRAVMMKLGARRDAGAIFAGRGRQLSESRREGI